jgi:Uma2 family endonuclease
VDQVSIAMSQGTLLGPIPAPESQPPLEAGDRLDQPTFHARYEAMPEGTRAELIEGIVYISSPLKRPHGRVHTIVIGWLLAYERATPGIEVLDNATNILGPQSEPQPDVSVRILPEYGGQTHEENEYIVGAPELLVEIASGTESIDLHAKRRDYEQAGVREYVVLILRQARVLWLRLRDGRFTELTPAADGTLRSEVFPGLWLDPLALFRHDLPIVLEVLRQGLETPEHAELVRRLGTARKQ